MEYYRLIVNGNMRNPLNVIGLDTNYYKANITKEEFEKVPKGLVTYYDYSVDLELPDYCSKPVVLFSDNLKNTLQIYENDLQGKPIQFFAKQRDINKTFSYWFLWIEQIECLHASCEWNPNGSLKEIILDQSKICQKDVFRIKGIKEDRVIVTLPVVESILRRHMYGIGFEKVKVI